MTGKLYKTIIVLLIPVLLLTPLNKVLAANTHSIDLEASSSQYLSITDANQTGLDITGDMTIEAWIKGESWGVAGSPNTIVGKHANGISWNRAAYYFRVDNAGSSLSFGMSNGSTGGIVAVSFSPDTGTWYHLAVTYDASAGSATFYVNGSQQGTTQTGLVTSGYNNAIPFFIGCLWDNTNSPDFLFDGLIDDVRVWNDIRTSTEISDNYQKELVGNETNLVGYWKLNDDLLDETSNNNDLTNNNSATFSTDVPFGEVEEAIIRALPLF